MITLEGVYTLGSSRPRFHQVNAPDQQHLEKILNRIIARAMHRFVTDGLLIPDQEQPCLDLPDTDTLDALNAASTRYCVDIGPGSGGRTLTLKNPGLQRKDTQPKPFTVDKDGSGASEATCTAWCVVPANAGSRASKRSLCRDLMG